MDFFYLQVGKHNKGIQYHKLLQQYLSKAPTTVELYGMAFQFY